ncbi:MAG TPA: UDP-N-acetylmuramoyl-tripeptide--D-alanyl-D-alanine ligase [Bacteroidia bacterium]|nr:UDP-N-acetylmuramoyl-tripeptide--D-alanyl-D-alanine ligase [Bacteroidia bacterium]HNU34195.1 UDP-N-acetylmuramoyl-tripeptide--D-alanyl-D-alanine ligase [Bacteroidia bacterium]
MTYEIKNIYTLFLKSTGVSTDTRKIDEGKIYFALKGPNFNGNTFAQKALEQGALCCVIDEPQQPTSDKFILVDDVLSALQSLANYHRKHLNIPVLGITGSNGKTTSKELCAAVLSKKYKTLFTQGNLNNHIGVPLTLLQINKQHEFAVIEMGANHQGEIDLLSSICEPTHGFITNVGKAHLEGFGGFEGVIKGKTELYRFLIQSGGTIFCNSDNTFLFPLCKDYGKLITYGATNNASVFGEAHEGEFLTVNWKDSKGNLIKKIKTQLTGSYNLENVLVAICIGKNFGVSNDDIQSAIQAYTPSNQRSQVMQKGSNTLIIDAYNANPTSMIAALKNLAVAYKGKKVIVLGDMFELGDESYGEHKQVLHEAIHLNPHLLLLVGKWFNEVDKEKKGIHFTNSVEAKDYLKSNLPANSTVLIKGSRSSKMEEVLGAF